MPNSTEIQWNHDGQELVLRLNTLVLIENPDKFEALRGSVNTLLESNLGQSPGWRVLSVDLRQAQSLNSLGLSLLYWLVSQTARFHKRTRILVSSRHLYRIATFCRLPQVAEVKWIQEGTPILPRTIGVQ